MNELIGSVVIVDDRDVCPLIGVIIEARWSSLIDDHLVTIKWTDLEEDVYSYSYLRKYIHLQRANTNAINNS